MRTAGQRHRSRTDRRRARGRRALHRPGGGAAQSQQRRGRREAEGWRGDHPHRLSRSLPAVQRERLGEQTGPTEYGGQGFPQMVSACFHEMLMAASLSFRVYSGLTEGAVLALCKHGDEALRRDYLAKLVSGEWAGTMCLTEPQAGTDLALLRTRAEAQADGSYAISGSKIFISGGEQDLTENIVHLVLDAPGGRAGRGEGHQSVPGAEVRRQSRWPPGERNSLGCGAIEHKMGIKGASTCVMNFDGARGWLLGQANQGLACMFTMMNERALPGRPAGPGYRRTGLPGRPRLRPRTPAVARPGRPAGTGQGRRPDHRAPRRAAHAADPEDPGRRLPHAGVPVAHASSTWNTAIRMLTARRAATRRAALLIPIVKAFLTDVGQEVASLGVQVYGGHGFIREWGMEQLMRDSRITQIYEGTNGIQALDLVRPQAARRPGRRTAGAARRTGGGQRGAARACCAGATG
ncbi:acyl-CoA dehydrogenase family protein [Pseudomonas aeruginosa]